MICRLLVSSDVVGMGDRDKFRVQKAFFFGFKTANLSAQRNLSKSFHFVCVYLSSAWKGIGRVGRLTSWFEVLSP